MTTRTTKRMGGQTKDGETAALNSLDFLVYRARYTAEIVGPARWFCCH